MSKTQLQTNNAKLSALITELQGKAAGGGGAAETCTVTVSAGSSSYRPYNVSYMTNEDVPAKVITQNSSLSVTLQNVLCGSAVTVGFYRGESVVNSAFTLTNAEIMTIHDYEFAVFRVTAPSGGTATIYYTGGGSGGGVL